MVSEVSKLGHFDCQIDNPSVLFDMVAPIIVEMVKPNQSFRPVLLGNLTCAVLRFYVNLLGRGEIEVFIRALVFKLCSWVFKKLQFLPWVDQQLLMHFPERDCWSHLPAATGECMAY